MKYRILLIFLILQLVPAQAELEVLLSYQQLGDSGAYVSSGFHDWRTVSKYRRRAGLHAGYDIAMLAGSPVRAAWSGTVVALTPWYGSEWGVTVRDGQGFEATYGHISPSVRVGSSVRPGDVLGYVVVDHVDVKVRDRRGRHVDFAKLDFDSQNPGIPPSAEQLKKQQAELAKRVKVLRAEVRKTKRAYELGLLPRKKLDDLREQLSQIAPGIELKSLQDDQPLTQEPTRSLTDSLLQATHRPDF